MMNAKGPTLNQLLVMLVVVMGLFHGPQLQAADLGRLFTTTAERQLLDKLRRENRPLIDNMGAAEKEKAMVYNGIVTRSNGDRQIWINGKAVNGRKGPDGVRIHKGPDQNHHVILSVPGKHNAVRVKPGQSWSLGSGKVTDFRSNPSGGSGSAAKP